MCMLVAAYMSVWVFPSRPCCPVLLSSTDRPSRCNCLQAMALKSSGAYVSRGLGYSSCEFEVVECVITSKQRQVRDRLCSDLKKKHMVTATYVTLSREQIGEHVSQCRTSHIKHTHYNLQSYNALSDFWQELKRQLEAALQRGWTPRRPPKQQQQQQTYTALRRGRTMLWSHFWSCQQR